MDRRGTDPTTPPDSDVSRELRRRVMNGASLALAGANVVLQLARPGVARGVLEGSVESGDLFTHPLKRTRTSLGYIMIALLGSDEERLALRREVDRQHRLVRPPASDAPRVSAFDPDLQLWVAACMYVGARDAMDWLDGPIPEDVADEAYAHCARLATTLQVPASRWPADRAAFEDYWRRSLAEVTLTDATRRYLLDLVDLRFLPRPLARVLGPLHRLLTTGFLPVELRDALELSWDERRAARFRAVTRLVARLNRALPPPARRFPWNLALVHARRRLRLGRDFV